MKDGNRQMVFPEVPFDEFLSRNSHLIVLGKYFLEMGSQKGTQRKYDKNF
jgi:hypothetical protein